MRLGQLQRYLNAAEQLGALPLIYTGLSSGLRQCELITLSWADFHIRCRYILKRQRLLTLNSRAEHLLERIPETGRYVFLNPKTGAPYQLHEFYYLHKRILKQAVLPWVAFRNLQRQCREVGDMTLKDYILRWQEAYDKNQSRPTTYAAHGYIFKNHILPRLGEIPLSELTVEQVGDFLEERKHFGGHRPESPEYPGLGEHTMRHIHRLLQQCLDQAMRDGLIAENPAP